MMPVLDGRDLFVLHAVAFLSGMILGGVYSIFRAVSAIIPQRNNKVYRIFLKFLPNFLSDTLFSLIFTIWNVLMFSAYGGGSVRISAIITEVFGCGMLVWLINSVIGLIKKTKTGRMKSKGQGRKDKNVN